MKKEYLFFILIIVFSVSANAQVVIDQNPDDDKIETIAGSMDIYRISGFGGPIMTFSSFGNNFGYLMGGGGGIYINRLFLGGYGEGLTTNIKLVQNNELSDLDFGHGGLWIGYEFAHRKLIHPVVSLKGGWGSAILKQSDFERNRANLYILTPSAGVEMNVTNFFKINASVEYRKVFGANQFDGVNEGDFSAIQYQLRFIFGWFN